ncbi:unnamed protein product [Phytomonas sp. EM1]|nr:unnamed protein product [Phytomonas sp. EM1]|eukprot:CCW64829.1 unnamed protein product [Phytomonas sp. isolate EM1]
MLVRSCSGHLYDLLEVPPNSSTEEISRRYRLLALRYHPDRTGGVTTEEFKEIEEAHRILTDPTQRRLYDTLGRERMKFIGDSGLLTSLCTAFAIRTALSFVGLVACLLLCSTLLLGIQLDSKKNWSWGLITLPLWFLSPFLMGVGLTALVAAVKFRTFVAAIVGLELIMIVVGAVISTLVLAGTLSPPSCAFIPWTLWYGLMSLRGFYVLLPSVYMEKKKEMDASMRAAGVSSTGAADAPPDGNSMTSCASPSRVEPSVEWSWCEYGVDVAREMLELLCVVAFICLAYIRAAQGPVGADSNDPNRAEGEDFLSFWVVFAPLITYFGAMVILQAFYAYLYPLPSTSGGSQDYYGETPSSYTTFRDYNSGNATGAAMPSRGGAKSPFARSMASANVKRQPSCWMRLLRAVVATIWPASWLYMVCMWAAKMEWEYNHRDTGNSIHPSFFVACIPLLAGMSVVMLSSCCMCCGLGIILDELKDVELNTPEPTPASPTRANMKPHAQAWDAKPSNQAYSYQSVDRRDIADHVALGIPSSKSKGKAAQTLEEID